jgi:hypothetical protein
MSIWEKIGFKKGPKPTPEQERENQRVEIVRKILMLDARIKEVEKNVRMFGSAPADNALLSNLQKSIDELNERLVALGGKPIKREETDREPAAIVEQKGGERPIGREAAERIVEETAEVLAEKISQEGHRPTKRDFNVIRGGKKSSAEEKK